MSNQGAFLRKLSRSDQHVHTDDFNFSQDPGQYVAKARADSRKMLGVSNIQSKYTASSSSTPSGNVLTSGETASILSDDSKATNSMDKYDLMTQYLYKAAKAKGWFDSVIDSNEARVALRVFKRQRSIEYRCFPPEVCEVEEASFARCAMGLNVEVALKLKYPVIDLIMESVPAGSYDIALGENTRIQIIETLADLPRARKYQYSAFVRDEQSFVVWADDVREVIYLATLLENKMISMVWESGAAVPIEDVEDFRLEAKVLDGGSMHESIHEIKQSLPDVERADATKRRPVMLIQPFAIGLSIMVLMTFLGLWAREMTLEIKADGKYLRLLSILYLPAFALFCTFFTLVLAGTVVQLLGPVNQMDINSRNYSAHPPQRLSSSTDVLPHITIQCPVYKESLAGVIDPTIQSLLAAVTTYELQGGSANIFVNDDGLQAIPEEEAQARKTYYNEHLVGWVARPPHGKDGFIRAGRFKKASNMNFAMNVSNKVELRLESVARSDKWTDTDEITAYETSLQNVIDEDGRVWAAGDIRIGDIVLLVDSDTRIPEDCLLDAASEFAQNPEIGILQHTSGVMQVVHNYWENLIAWFTRLIYFAIQYATSGGDSAAFVGHNAFLRWSAIQEIAWKDVDGVTKYWSESHVSEDFEMSLKLQCKGYIVRLASYYRDGFKEGVSLTVYDELTRWQKYAYGCSELVFHPIYRWPYKGPFTPLFRRFLFSEIKTFAKYTILAYIGTYYAIGGAWILTLVNYFIIGWIHDEVDHFYVSSFENFLALIVVFAGAAPIANALVRYRVKRDSFLGALWENFKWIPLMTIFLGGLSWHLSLALLSHMFGFNMQWGATAKELESSNFFRELPKILKGFSTMLLLSILGIAAMIVLAYFVPWNWRITGFYSGLPLGWILAAHILQPLVLNPQLMTFSF